MRLLNILVIGALILAASFVYKIKFDSTLQAERVAKLDTPGRIQGLASRHLVLRPIVPTQFDSLDRLPERPPVVPLAGDPIGAMLAPAAPDTTGSVPAQR